MNAMKKRTPLPTADTFAYYKKNETIVEFDYY
jgi:hypothetical protein